MGKSDSANEPGLLRMVAVPALISLAVTMLRLAGELEHWSPKWFSSETGGIAPTGVSWLVGITWLALPFGAYFGYRLTVAGQGPQRIGRAFIRLAGGAAILFGGFGIIPILKVGFPRMLVFVWLTMAFAAIIQFAGWPRLFSVLLAYGLASRIPVAIIMFFAMRGNWGTHYDYVNMPAEFQMPLVPGYFWLAFFPQLVFWVGFTVVLGSLSGAITAGIMRVWRVQRVQGG